MLPSVSVVPGGSRTRPEDAPVATTVFAMFDMALLYDKTGSGVYLLERTRRFGRKLSTFNVDGAWLLTKRMWKVGSVRLGLYY